MRSMRDDYTNPIDSPDASTLSLAACQPPDSSGWQQNIRPVRRNKTPRWRSGMQHLHPAGRGPAPRVVVLVLDGKKWTCVRV